MIVAALLAVAPVVLALPNVHEGNHFHKRTGSTGTVVPSVTTTGGTTYYARGCYDELKSGLMALNHDISSTLSSITVENCINGCATAGYAIAGVMNGNQCLCDNAISLVAPILDASQCSTPCSGNAAEICGGTWHYEIYTTSPTNPLPNPSAPSSVGSGCTTYTNIGCYVDVVSSRTIPDWTTNSDTMTPEQCASICNGEGYSLAGVEWGRECYCGNQLVNANLTVATDCSQACAGSSVETCGGEARIQVYSLDDSSCGTTTTTTTPATTTTTTTTTTTGHGASTTTPCTTSTHTTTSTSPATTTTGAPIPAPTCGNNDNDRYLHQGCYQDNTNHRTLNDYSFTSSSMTPTMCSSKCFSKGYKYSALENGNTCYCGNNCPSQQNDSRKCNKPCGGDRQHTGGGSSGCLTVYKSFTLGWSQSYQPSRNNNNNNNNHNNNNNWW